MSNNLKRLLSLLGMAGAITIDDGPLLTEWDTEDPVGTPDNQVVRFTWTDGACDYSDILTEGGIAVGQFDDDGKFVCKNHEGETTVIRFFVLERMDGVSGKRAADLFFSELLESVETLTGIAEAYGPRTLADLMYLQNAILSGGFIDCDPSESSVLDVVRGLPLGEVWLGFVREVKNG